MGRDPVATGGPAPPAGPEGAAGPKGPSALWIAAAALALTLGVAGWAIWFRSGAEADLSGPGVYHGTSEVVAVLPAPSALNAERPVVILRHDAIPDPMDKGMTHPFLVRSPRLLRGIAPGARVRFTLKDTPGALLVVRLEALR